MTNDELKNKIQYLYEKEIAVEKPKGEKFIISKIGFTKIHNLGVEGFQYSRENKYVPFETLFKCYKQLDESNLLSKDWFKKTFSFECTSRPCNFTTIGSIFVALGIAEYISKGMYKKVSFNSRK